MIRWALVAGVLATALGAAARWVGDALPSDCQRDGPCGDCHERSLPANHVRAFVTTEHGGAALLNRAQCDGCHDEAVCDTCHSQRTPAWHVEALSRPGRDAAGRDRHVREATARGSRTCLTCHDARFRTQCAECHVRSEPGFAPDAP